MKCESYTENFDLLEKEYFDVLHTRLSKTELNEGDVVQIIDAKWMIFLEEALLYYLYFYVLGFEQAEVLSSQNNGSSLDCLSMIVQSINGPLQPSSESHFSSHHWSCMILRLDLFDSISFLGSYSSDVCHSCHSSNECTQTTKDLNAS